MSEITELRARVEDLSQRVATLEFALQGNVDPYVELGLTPNEAKILALLMKRALVTREAFQILLYGIESDPAARIVDVYISRLRRKLQIAIDCQYRNGWSLTPKTKYQVNQLIEAPA